MKEFAAFGLLIAIRVTNVVGSCTQDSDCTCVASLCQDPTRIIFSVTPCTVNEQCICSDTGTGKFCFVDPTDDTLPPTKAPSQALTIAAKSKKAPSGAPSLSPTKSPTNQPTTVNPSKSPTDQPSKVPTVKPTGSPSQSPTDKPTTANPTKSPTDQPSKAPTTKPTNRPSDQPATANPTKSPTDQPTTSNPTKSPTDQPSKKPTDQPTTTPSLTPSDQPTTASPTKSPTDQPSEAPTTKPTNRPSDQPATANPTKFPTDQPTTSNPTKSPTDQPSKTPTVQPTTTPSLTPSDQPITHDPTNNPTEVPSQRPTKSPTNRPSKNLTNKPSEAPSLRPSKAPSTLPTKEPTINPTQTNTPTPTCPIYPTCGEPERECGWGIWNIWTCQCDCAPGFCLSANQECYDGCTTTLDFNPFGGCAPGCDCPWYPDPAGSTNCVTTVNFAGIYNIHRTAEQCCERHFSYLNLATCVSDSEQTVDAARVIVAEKASRPNYYYPDVFGRDNCIYHNEYYDWMMDSYSEFYLFPDDVDCCSMWYPARTDCPDLSDPTEIDVIEKPYPVKPYFYPHESEMNCRFGRNYPQWMAQTLYLQHYLYTTPEECCTHWYPEAGDNCPLGPDDGVEDGSYWQSDVAFYPIWKGNWCNFGNDYPEWMADPINIGTHLFDSALACCQTWYSDQVSECETNVGNPIDGEHESAEWYPTLAWPYDCIDDGNIPSWMLQTGYKKFYVFLVKRSVAKLIIAHPRFRDEELGQWTGRARKE